MSLKGVGALTCLLTLKKKNNFALLKREKRIGRRAVALVFGTRQL